MPKAGIIYNDIKPIACRIAAEWRDKLVSVGWDVCMATGEGGILGYSEP
ncbi:MAG: NAD(+) kinase, partial [Cyanobacteria bacterium CRU_2_1]|nr:NAD(+) kinase [Cyanobacteria bacterium CRU_2_1]